MSLGDAVPELVARFPWIPVLFLVPLCILYDLYCYVRLRACYLMRRLSGRASRVHEEKVKKVQEQVMEWNRTGRKNRMCTARPSE